MFWQSCMMLKESAHVHVQASTEDNIIIGITSLIIIAFLVLSQKPQIGKTT